MFRRKRRETRGDVRSPHRKAVFTLRHTGHPHAALRKDDVPSSRLAARFLPQAEALFKNLFEHAPDANLLADKNGQILLANTRAEQMFGCTQAEMAGQPMEQWIPGLLNIALMPADQAHSLQFILSARDKSGRDFPVEITLNTIHDTERPLALCVIRDISRRVALERKTQKQHELVRLLQDVAVAANKADSVAEAFRYAIERIAKHLGWPLAHAFIIEDDLALLPSQVWTGETEPFAIFRAVSEALRFRPGLGLPGMVLETNQPEWMNNLAENPHFARGREARLAGLKTGLAVPVLAGKEVVGMLEFFHTADVPPDPDLLEVLPLLGVQVGRVVERRQAVEALRKSAAQLHMVMNNLPVILWVLDRTGRLTLLEGKRVATSEPKPETLIGRNLFEILDTRPDLTEMVQRALKGEEVHTELPGPNGSAYDTYFTPYFDANSAVDGVIGLAFDVTDRQRMETELEEMKHRLLDSVDNERARLAQQLHDGPLQDLYGVFYQLQEIQSMQEALGIQDTLERSLQTIQGVNATLRVICGELHPNTLVHLGLQRAIRSHAERLQDRIENTVLHLDLADDSALQPPLPIEQRLGLYRIYQQLMTNATYHAQARHIWVRLRLLANQVILEVLDNGKGFNLPKNWIELVRQGHFGLANTLERVQRMDGQLEVTSVPGSGTSARVTVPRKASEAVAGE